MHDKITFDYHYGRESSQYHYYQIPQVLIKDPYFKKLSLGAKMLYSIMLNRMRLSQKKEWINSDGRVYIYFSVSEIMAELNICKETAIKFLAELDAEKGIGLIERKRQGQGKPDKIFPKHFARASPESEADFPDFQRSEKPTSGSPEARPPEVGKTDHQKSEYPTTGGRFSLPPEDGDSDFSLYNKKYLENFTEKSYLIRSDLADKIERIRAEVKERIEYDILCEQHDPKAVYGIFELIVEVLTTPDGEIVIAKRDRDVRAVQERFMQLDRECVDYVLYCMKRGTSEVKNIRAYLLAALFHAPTTIDSFYTAEVNHDMNREV